MEPKHIKSEAALAEEARGSIKVEEPPIEPGKPVHGKSLPDGFENLAAGVYGHHCIDPRGIYRRNWVCLKLHKQHDNMPQRQYFNHNGKSWLVEVGTWVDVPPEIMSLLSLTEQEVISMDIGQANLLIDRNVPKVVDRIPRFSYTAIPSA